MKQLLTILGGALFLASACLPLAAQQPGPVKPAAPAQVAKPAVKMPPVKASVDSSAPGGWKKFQFGEPALFSIILPEKHDAVGEILPLPGVAKPATSYVYTGETEVGVFMAMYVENLPFVAGGLSENIKESFYDGMWQGMLGGMKAELERTGLLLKITSGEKKTITLSGLQGRSQDFTFGPLNGHARMAIAGQRAYMALIMAPPDGGGEREAFFNSFEIHAKR